MLRHAEAIRRGVAAWGAPMSRHFHALKAIHARLVELETTDAAELEARTGLKPEDHAAACE